MSPPHRPRLRPVETVVVPDERFGRALMLRDTEGVTSSVAIIPAPLVPIVARFDGRYSLEEIAEHATREAGEYVPVEVVERLASELDRSLFLDSPAYRAERRRIEDEFSRAEVRPASHAGGAYHESPDELRRYLNDRCLGAARRSAAPAPEKGSVRALVAPHIDPWRGAVCYGHAYRALEHGLGDDVDTFVLLGTSHAPMREPFALCRKAFDTPLGPLEADLDAIDEVARRCPFDPYADGFNHKREHSIEFQAVFVRHLIGARPARIIPVLCGLGDSPRTGRDPSRDRGIESFVQALAEACDAKGANRVVVIAGADLAHVGPRFGDPAPYGAGERRALESADRQSLGLAAAGDGAGFFGHVQRDLETRRVCGLGPIYTLLRLLPRGVRGELLHYEQTVDPEEGSIVSHAAAVFR